MPKWLWAIPVVFGAIGIFGFIFWLWMLIDAIKNEKEDKAMWVVLIILLNLLGAIIYYFAKKRKRAKA
ncbi:PLDc N-terminal domain-containing protein [Candidatus Peregrinibacteria bacterium]|nr:PLDc N-terminal domain-containing protein [Candidatus Peregrinibacteria bacterium]